MFHHRIEFYKFLTKYRKQGYNVIQLQKAIKRKEIKKIPFNISKLEAVIIINDFIVNNKSKIESNTQLQLFPLI